MPISTFTTAVCLLNVDVCLQMARLSAKEQEVYEVQASARDLYRARRFVVALSPFAALGTTPGGILDFGIVSV